MPSACGESASGLEGKSMTIPVIVGGGIRDPATAKKMLDSGAAAVVTGTVAESDPAVLGKIVSAIKS